MSYQLCQSIVRMVGVFTVCYGATVMAYSLIAGLAATNYISRVSGGLSMRQTAAGGNEMLFGVLLAEACIVAAGILMVVWSPRLTRIILKDPGSMPPPVEPGPRDSK